MNSALISATKRIGIWIDYTRGEGGLIATLTGKKKRP